MEKTRVGTDRRVDGGSRLVKPLRDAASTASRPAIVALVVLALLAVPVARAAELPFLTTWGSEGDGEGQFRNPQGIAVDSAGNVYVADTNNHRIQKFSPSGTLLATWGSAGSGDGQFQGPQGIAIDSAGNVYVADTQNHRIQKFDSSGEFVAKWGSIGAGLDQFNWPRGLAVDAAGNLYVADYLNDRVLKFTSSGTFVDGWGADGSSHHAGFIRPADIAIDADSFIYVVEAGSHRVQKFKGDDFFWLIWGSTGSGDGQFQSPNGIAVDTSGNVYVADTNNHRIQRFDDLGTHLASWGDSGADEGQFATPMGVAADAGGIVYVVEHGNHRVQKFGTEATGDSGSLAGTITAASEPGGPCLIVGGSTIDFGTQTFNDGSVPPVVGTIDGGEQDSFSVENCGDDSVELLARGTDAVSRTSDAAWDLLPITGGDTSCTVTGPDTTNVYGLVNEGEGSGSQSLSTSDTTVNPALAAGHTRSHQVFIQMPCVGSAGAGETFDLTVTYTAIEP
jgi:DNA-binding beta-propeller fold protein YncE